MLNLIKTIITNEKGIAEITLPYGKYKLTQLTTTEGYQKITPIQFEIVNDSEIFYELKDYKIPVPNTSTLNKYKNRKYTIRKILYKRNKSRKRI